MVHMGDRIVFVMYNSMWSNVFVNVHLLAYLISKEEIFFYLFINEVCNTHGKDEKLWSDCSCWRRDNSGIDFDTKLELYIILKTPEAIIVARKDIGIEISAEKTKYVGSSAECSKKRTPYIWLINPSKIFWNIPYNQNYIFNKLTTDWTQQCLIPLALDNVLQFAMQKRNIKMYKSTVLLLVLNRCDSWSIILGDQRSLRVSSNVVLRKTCEPKREEVTGD